MRLGLLGAGGTAVLVTDNGTGSAALVSIGGALLVAGGMWERLESFEFAGTKWELRVVERLRDRAAEAEARGDKAVQPPWGKRLKLYSKRPARLRFHTNDFANL
jgi:hypothetical protein